LALDEAQAACDEIAPFAPHVVATAMISDDMLRAFCQRKHGSLSGCPCEFSIVAAAQVRKLQNSNRLGASSWAEVDSS
jgi:hypothetical protein